MGSRNSEHSGSMDSDEFSAFIGHNYAVPAPILQHQLHFEVDNATGPGLENSSHGSQSSPPEVTSQNQVPSLASLKANIQVKNGILTVANLDEGVISESQQQKKVTWSNIVTKNVVNSEPVVGNATISYNEDGTATVRFSNEFFDKAQKQWETSIIGYFIGGSFAFKYIREQAQRFWKNRGLTGVYYNTKGYYTFRFGTLEEKDRALSLNTIQIGGKTMFLKSWTEGNKFKRNIIDKVPCWIRLVDVPDIFWCKEGLSSIASTVGKPLKFDAVTAKFEPLKYAGVQVELAYSAPRPDFVRVPLPNTNDEVKIEVQYGELPYSCSLCNAFGHSLSRCFNNPERVVKKPRTTKGDRPSHEAAKAPNDDVGCIDSALVPYTIGTFCGCPVIREEDEILQKQQACNSCDLDDTNGIVNTEPGHGHKESNEELEPGDDDLELGELVPPMLLGNAFQSLADYEEGNEQSSPISNEEVPGESTSIIKRKRINNMSTKSGSQSMPRLPSSKKNNADAEGFVPVITKRSLRLAGKPVNSPKHQ